MSSHLAKRIEGMEFRDLLAEGFPSVIFLMGGLLRPPRGFHDTAGRSGGHGDGGDVRLPLELWCEGVEGFIDCPKPATDQRDAEDGPKLFAISSPIRVSEAYVETAMGRQDLGR